MDTKVVVTLGVGIALRPETDSHHAVLILVPTLSISINALFFYKYSKF